MGGNCCVAVRDKPFPKETGFEVSAHRNIRYSPSWSFRWDHRTHIEDIMDNPARFSHHNCGNVVSGTTRGADPEIEGLSGEGSPLGPLQEPPIKTRTHGHSKDDNGMIGITDKLMGSNSSREGSPSIKSPGIASASNTSPSISIPSIPSSSAFNLDPSSSWRYSRPSDQTSSRNLRCSPHYQVSTQVSDSRIPSLKPPNENSSLEERQPFALNDFSTGGSQAGSSNGWSKLMASSQRERWPIDHEFVRWPIDHESPGSIKGNTACSNTLPLPLPASDLETCGVCSKPSKERSPWSTQRLVSTNELPEVAVLFCGHVYHAECLETVTTEGDRYEPPCPVCTNGEKPASKARSKISRIVVADDDGDFDSVSERERRGRKGPRMGASSSMKSYFGRPFLGRHVSMGSRLKRLESENETTRKKGFWARYWQR